ncbi:MAG: hypothetical protein PF487_08785 [Bacteroidales bacterium]|jgi:hypothetical protein|nr:hypothetical protein [Bacteroidales bacterium]
MIKVDKVISIFTPELASEILKVSSIKDIKKGTEILEKDNMLK